jgi:hypothetical protein
VPVLHLQQHELDRSLHLRTEPRVSPTPVINHSSLRSGHPSTTGTLLVLNKNAREDLKELGIRLELYAEETETGPNLPVAATTLSKAERKEFYQFLHDLKAPSGYSSNIKRLVLT